MLTRRKILIICLIIAICVTSGVWLSSMYGRVNHTVGTGAAVVCEGKMNPYMGACLDIKKQPITEVPLMETTAMYGTFALVATTIALALSSRAKSS
jgi:hypothetical protein